ncbi:MAG: LptF/LptG family permease [Dysgonomonas sp.]
MLGIKRIYIYLLKNFIPVFVMTFGICLFLVLMQFLWKYVEDLVGKGLDTSVIAELFLYAALNLVPLALPLAILLTSLMTFGSMGENFELLATKAAGISLIKTMRPLIVLVGLISIGAFFFQNDAVPRVQVKFFTLLRSVKMKSPELEIPESSFYNEINNYSLYVKTKNKETGMLYDVMIYDTSKGFNNMAVIVCDSAKMESAATKDYLKLTLFHGQQFANFNQSTNRVAAPSKFVPYSRENFRKKEIIITFDANFNRLDESAMEGSQASKNIQELKLSIDSITHEVDSLNFQDRKYILEYGYLAYRTEDIKNKEREITPLPVQKYNGSKALDMDTLLASYSLQDQAGIFNGAISQVDNNKSDYLIRSGFKMQTQKNMRLHMTELHRKFTLSFACLIFFFIGAPLGAIIRKGGLGMPVVISVILFIIYYIIDNVGYKMARDGVWGIWQGVWLSSFVLFPLGVFFTYKANNDSALFNPDAYRKFIQKILGDKFLAAFDSVIHSIDTFFGKIKIRIAGKKKIS